jgi:fibronectin-binding autotransporter adhesin
VALNAGSLDVNSFSPTFANLAGAAGTVLDNTTATPATVTFNNSAADTFSGVVQNSGGGAISIVKNGNGTLTLGSTNTYTGGTTINAGVLKVNDDTGLGGVGGAVTISAATLEYAGNSTTARTIIPANAGSTIQVDTGFTVTNTNSAGITGTGLAKTGAGTFVVSGPLTLTNSPTITGGGTLAIASPTNSFTLMSPLIGGTFQVDAGGVYSLPAFTFGNATTAGNLRINGGSFTATGAISLVGISNSGGGAAITVEAGSNASFGNINFGTADGANLNIKGGNVSIGAISIPRSGAVTGGANPDFSHGVIVSGGTTTITSLALGTGNSWGTLSVSGGNVTISGPITLATQVTAGRGGAIQVTGGTLTSTDPGGLQMVGINATNQNNKAIANFTGGTATFEKIVMVTDDAITSSSAIVNVGGAGSTGALYIGSGGIQTHLAGGSTATVNLTGGILGAKADWSANSAFVLADTNGGATIQAADAANVPHDITITGAISGSTLTKTGGGTLSLFPSTTTNTFGGINLNAGNLVGNSDGLASGSIVTTAANQTVTINQGQGISFGGGSTFSSISGPASLIKTGAGTATLGGSHSYTGNTTIGQGTLVLGTTDAISSTAKVTLAGGKLGTGSLSQTFSTAPLALTSNSAIDMGSGSSSIIHFADSGAAANAWSGTLSIVNWDGAAGVVSNGSTDQVLFTNSGNGGLSASQKAAIHFAGYNGAVALNSTLFPGSIEIVPASLSTLHLGDWNMNGAIDANDIPTMLSALTDLNAYKLATSPLHSAHPQALSVDDLLNIGDVDLSGNITNADIQAELDLAASLGLGSTAAVPEPASFLLLALGAVVFFARCCPKTQRSK